MDNERIPENERLQIEQIRDLETEVLQVEEVDDHSSGDNSEEHGENRAFNFNTGLASAHSYLGGRHIPSTGVCSRGLKSVSYAKLEAKLYGHFYLTEVEDTQGRLSLLEGGAVVDLPLLFLEGVVLFPEATLPLTVVRRRFKAAVETAMSRVDAPYTVGVVHDQGHPGATRAEVTTIGTTAEIRQFRRVEDGSLNVVTRGLQRFHLQQHWMDVEGVPWAKVQIMQEDIPLRTPKDAFGQLASVGSLVKSSYSHVVPSESSCVKGKKYEDEENGRECMSDRSTDESDLSLTEMRMQQSSIHSSNGCRSIYDPVSSNVCVSRLGRNLERSFRDYSEGSQHSCMGDVVSESIAKENVQGRQSVERWKKTWAADESNWLRRAPRSFWPYWVYRMYDSYSLARRVTDMWRQIIRVPNLDSLVKKPDLLSFYIASKIPVSECTRQELLAIDGVSYRLRREIELLERFDLIRCKICRTIIAKRTDVVVMSSDGPFNAYANAHGYVHGVLTVSGANGLSVGGLPTKEYSWFPGYEWTIAHCDQCGSNIGWLFTATEKKLQPRSFWGIQTIRLADDMA